jgi:predicted regulator of Ras-like GTPase activity (Roadblock/LC7/MglB family)
MQTSSAVHLLKSLVVSNSVIQLAVLTTSDGQEIAAYPQRPVVTQRVAAMSSSLQALSEAIMREASLGNGRNLIIESDTGSIVILGLTALAPRASLAVLASGTGILGQLLWAARDCCQSLERALGE